MKVLVLPALMALMASAQLFEPEPKDEEPEYWTRGGRLQGGLLSSDPFGEIIQRMSRKLQPKQFIGLMGKRSMANPQTAHKRHKVKSFVGLMGRRSQEGPDSYERGTPRIYDRRR